MPTTVQFRRGTTAQNNAFTGAVGEITIDTDKDTIVVHDGSTAGGFPLISSADSAPTFISSSASAPVLTLKNTADDATGPILTLESDRATPTDNDVAGTIEFRASDDAGAQVLTASIVSKATDVSNGSEDGNLEFSVHAAGSSTKIATIDATGVTINSGSLDVASITTNTISSTDSTELQITDNLVPSADNTYALGSPDKKWSALYVEGSSIFLGNLVLKDNGDNSLGVFQSDGTTAANIGLSGAIKVNTLESDDSTAIQIIDAVNISGAITGASTIDISGNATFGGTGAFTSTISSATGSTIGNLTLANGSITDSSGTISFDNENLTTTGTVTAGTITIGSGSITDSSGAISFGNENLTTTGTITGGIGVFDNIRIDNTAGEIDTSSGNLVIDSAGGTVTVDDNLTVTGNLQLDGNLTVSGTTTSVNTTNIEVQDALLELSKNNSGGTDVDSGILITRGSAGNNAAFYWNEGDDKFKAVLTTSAGTATAITDSSTATIVANLEGTSANLSGTVTYGSLSDGTITITAFADEDNMASNSATLVPTQQSVKAYVDTTIGALSSTTLTEGNSTLTLADAGTGTLTLTLDAATHTTFNSSGITLSTGNFVGNASTATTLQTARTIGGVSFNGSANINLPGVNTAGNQNTSGTAAVATTVTLVATNTTAATHYVTFVDAATGNENIRTDTDLTYNPSTNVLGTTASSAQYADLAELYSADQEYEPGTVMSFGGDSEITQSVLSHDTKVAGVVSTAPAYLMNAELENGTALALQGRTPVKVIGRIHKGDMLVASQTPGVACAMDSSFYAPGCVIGKALESYDSQSVGTIEVVVGRI